MLVQSSELQFPKEFNSSAPGPYLWRDLYLKAIFEQDKAKIADRIREAECALMHREHELFRSAKSSGERESVMGALNCLEALRVCISRSRAVHPRDRA